MSELLCLYPHAVAADDFNTRWSKPLAQGSHLQVISRGDHCLF